MSIATWELSHIWMEWTLTKIYLYIFIT